jgi:hypothetical protein
MTSGTITELANYGEFIGLRREFIKHPKTGSKLLPYFNITESYLLKVQSMGVIELSEKDFYAKCKTIKDSRIVSNRARYLRMDSIKPNWQVSAKERS